MTVSLRPGTLADSRAVLDVVAVCFADNDRRAGVPDTENLWLDPAWVADIRSRGDGIADHLSRTAGQFWVAECDGQIIGYARATLDDGVQELTEFFVLPDHQGGGVGRELFARTFPANGARRRVILATTQLPALARYLKTGVYPRFPIYGFFSAPRAVSVATDLDVEPAKPGADALAALREIDQAVIGFSRDAQHAYLLTDRDCQLYRRGDHVVGYAYFGKDTGPIALLDAADFPAVLARIETEAASRAVERVRFNVPMINQHAVNHLLGRGFHLDDFIMYFMSDEPFGTFENYIVTGPSFFL